MTLRGVVTRRRITTAALVALGAAVTNACGRAEGDAVTSGQGPAMRMTVAACVAEDVDVPASASVEIRQDGDAVSRIGSGVELPTWVEVTASSGTVQLVVDDEVVDEAMGEPGDRVVLAAGECTPPSSPPG